MPVFEYRGLNDGRQAVKGLLEADSAKTLRAQLRKDGVFLTDVLGQARGQPRRRAKGAAQPSAGRARTSTCASWRGGRITTDDIAITTRQLATLLRRGRDPGGGAHRAGGPGGEGAAQARSSRT